MLWRDIFRKLKDEGMVQISYEAVIKTRLASMIGDVPIYSFEVIFIKEDEELLHVELVDTYEELLDLIDREIVFRRCSRCGQLITEGFYHDMVRDKEFCSLNCMTKEMNEQYGVGNWRFAEAESFMEIGEHVLKNEYMFEIKSQMKNDNGAVEEVWVPYKMDYNPSLHFEPLAAMNGEEDVFIPKDENDSFWDEVTKEECCEEHDKKE